MCAQMHGMVLMDGSGKSHSNCVTWRDQRVVMPLPSGKGPSSSPHSESTPNTRQLGNELDPGRPLCYLFWFAEQGKL